MMKVRTSASDPLRIDWVQTPPDWRVGITLGPGKHTESSKGFRWQRDLADDLAMLVDKRVQTLVTLLETEEMARLGVPNLLTEAKKCGLDVIHFPIVDVSVPPIDEAQKVIAELLTRKDQGIVVHCNGGLGRSGVVVGCLLRALGVSASDARKRLVAARGPQCPETEVQRAFIDAFVP
jgi:protein-tyrosine phosphatase